MLCWLSPNTCMAQFLGFLAGMYVRGIIYVCYRPGGLKSDLWVQFDTLLLWSRLKIQIGTMFSELYIITWVAKTRIFVDRILCRTAQLEAFLLESYDRILRRTTNVLNAPNFQNGFGSVSWLVGAEILPPAVRPSVYPLNIAFTWMVRWPAWFYGMPDDLHGFTDCVMACMALLIRWWPAWYYRLCDDLHGFTDCVMTCMALLIRWWPAWLYGMSDDLHGFIDCVMTFMLLLVGRWLEEFVSCTGGLV
jgi:hypothetical protein